jgi:hypothetical protein
MTEEGVSSSTGGSGGSFPDGQDLNPDDVDFHRRWASQVDPSDEWDVGPKGHAVPPKRLFL